MKSHKIYLACFLGGALLATFLCLRYMKPDQVEKIINRERVVTKIEERPDGSKTTIIVSDKDKRSEVTKPTKKDWHVGALSSTDFLTGKPTSFGISVDRRILGDLYLGVQAQTGSPVMLRLSYSF
jgi:hypothetical protein